MAEVRKVVREDKYGTAKLKKETKEKPKNNKNVVKKNKKEENEKKSLFVKFRIFCNGVKNEFTKVHWTSKNDMLKYSIATIVFIVFFSVFFYGIDVIFALIKSLLN